MFNNFSITISVLSITTISIKYLTYLNVTEGKQMIFSIISIQRYVIPTSSKEKGSDELLCTISVTRYGGPRTQLPAQEARLFDYGEKCFEQILRCFEGSILQWPQIFFKLGYSSEISR